MSARATDQSRRGASVLLLYKADSHIGDPHRHYRHRCRPFVRPSAGSLFAGINNPRRRLILFVISRVMAVGLATARACRGVDICASGIRFPSSPPPPAPTPLCKTYLFTGEIYVRGRYCVASELRETLAIPVLYP